MVSVSTPPPPPPDPMLQQEQQQAQADLTAATGQQAQGDMASLMARYGSQLAFAQAMTAPLSPATGKG